jgi:predicted Holliday junction resolvase-like endonuclease
MELLAFGGLIAASFAVLVLLVLYLSLKARMSEAALARFEAWRADEIEAIRLQQMEIAMRETEVLLEQWKSLSEQEIRADAVQRSQSAMLGRITEHFVPYLDGFPYDPRDARFIGAPVDFVIFDGLSEGAVESIVFVEVKAGKGALSTRERRIRDAIRDKRVEWLELRPPAGVTPSS